MVVSAIWDSIVDILGWVSLGYMNYVSTLSVYEYVLQTLCVMM